MTCDDCANPKTCLYTMSCAGCVFRLIMSAPKGIGRKAMTAHVERTNEETVAIARQSFKGKK